MKKFTNHGNAKCVEKHENAKCVKNHGNTKCAKKHGDSRYAKIDKNQNQSIMLSILLLQRIAKEFAMYKILIIEDDATIRAELQILLEKYGYKTVVTEDFENIVKFALDDKPHLILLDINLPVYDGYHICREIRKQSRVPVIVVTSRDSDMDELMSMNLGADDFVTKPYNTQILLARISAIIARTYEAKQATELVFGELSLDIGKSSVKYKGATLELTKNELKILTLLIRNEGAITSRDDIMNELWQSNAFIDDNTLTVNINRLRKKLDEIGAIDILQTKRGQGYSLCD